MRTVKILALLGWILFLPVLSLAQMASSTSLVGTVLDSSGAAVPETDITAIEVSMHDTYHTVTSNAGEYVIPFVHIGTYTITATKTGFETGTHTDIIVEMNQTVRVDFALQLGKETQVVTVTGAPPITTDDATIRQNLNQTQIDAIPLNGRNSLQLADTTPGVILGFKASAAADPGFDFIGAGAREVSNDISLDGVSILNNLINKGQFEPSIDALDEFQVQTGTYSAQYGGYLGVHLNLVTKSGSNQIHGSGWEFVRNNITDARPFFQSATQPKLPLHRNQFGGEFGGPVVIPHLYNGKNKTFFMMDYEGARQLQSSPSLQTVMTAAMDQGNFNQISTQIYNPFAPGTPFTGNVIPANYISPISKAILAFIPTPQTSALTNNYVANVPTNDSFNQNLDRVDQLIGEKTRLFFRLAWDGDNALYGSTNPFDNQPAPNSDLNIMWGWTQTIRNNIVNDFRMGRQRPNFSALDEFETNPALQAQAGAIAIPGFTSTTANPGLAGIGITGYLGAGSPTPLFTNDSTWVVNDTFNYTHGAHSIMVGADLDKFHMYRAAVNSALGSFSFTGGYTGLYNSSTGATITPGFAPADFMLGVPLTDTTGNPYVPSLFAQWRDGFFVLDKWNVNRKLTVNIGMRWDMPTAMICLNGNADMLNSTFSAIIPQYPPTPGFVIQYGSHDLFAPRLSFAYRVTDKWVARGGFGIYYNPNHFNDWTLTNLNYPLSPAYTYQNLPAPSVPEFTIADPTPSAAQTAASPTPNFTTEASQHMPVPRMNQWSFSVERALWHNAGLDIQYLGSYSYHLDTSWDVNAPMPGPGAIQARRPFPKWGVIRAITNNDVGHYNGLSAVLTQRVFHGATLMVSYTYSHDIDMNSDSNSGYVGDPYNFWYDMGSSNWDMRHRLVATYVYKLPFFLNSHNLVARDTLGGWQASGVLTIQEGFPFYVSESGDPLNWGNSASERPNVLSPPSVNCGSGHLVGCISGSFAVPANYAIGNEGRNILHGPPLKDLDFALMKNIPLHERLSLQFRAEFFNFFNTPTFSNPSATFGTSSFGNVASTANINRQVQLAMKLMF